MATTFSITVTGEASDTEADAAADARLSADQHDHEVRRRAADRAQARVAERLDKVFQRVADDIAQEVPNARIQGNIGGVTRIYEAHTPQVVTTAVSDRPATQRVETQNGTLEVPVATTRVETPDATKVDVPDVGYAGQKNPGEPETGDAPEGDAPEIGGEA